MNTNETKMPHVDNGWSMPDFDPGLRVWTVYADEYEAPIARALEGSRGRVRFGSDDGAMLLMAVRDEHFESCTCLYPWEAVGVVEHSRDVLRTQLRRLRASKETTLDRREIDGHLAITFAYGGLRCTHASSATERS